MKTNISNIASVVLGTFFLLNTSVAQNDDIIVEGKINPVNCFGSNDGSIDLSVVGGKAPYSYEWNNGVTTEDLSGIYGGTYKVKVTDANNVVVEKSFVLKRPRPLSIMMDVNDQSSAHVRDASIESHVIGGMEPYNYVWSDGSTEKSIENLSTGDYELTVTDKNGCNLSLAVDVRLKKQPAFLSVEEEIFTSVNGK